MGYFLIRDSGLGIDNATASPRLDQFVDDVMDIETRQARVLKNVIQQHNMQTDSTSLVPNHDM